MVVLFGWQFFVAGPQLERAQQQAQIAAEQQAAADAALATPATPGEAAATPAPTGTQTYATREEAVAASQRVIIDTEGLSGSINLTRARIPDPRPQHYRETVDPHLPVLTPLTPPVLPQS